MQLVYKNIQPIIYVRICLHPNYRKNIDIECILAHLNMIYFLIVFANFSLNYKMIVFITLNAVF